MGKRVVATSRLGWWFSFHEQIKQPCVSWLAVGSTVACMGGEGDVTEVSRLSPGAGALAVETPMDVTRDSRIVFRSDRVEDGIGDLYTMASDGSDVTRLTSGGDFIFPEWSPDGESIVCRFKSDGMSGDVALVTPSGSPPVLLTQG